jgi:hypothetical protein
MTSIRDPHNNTATPPQVQAAPKLLLFQLKVVKEMRMACLIGAGRSIVQVLWSQHKEKKSKKTFPSLIDFLYSPIKVCLSK